MSLKTFLFSTLLATSAVATFSGASSSSYGGSSGSSSWSGGSGMSGGSWGAAASCPAGCQPIQAPPAGGNGELIVQVVSVSDANGSLKYFPNNIEAPVGSIVQFQFHPKVSNFAWLSHAVANVC